MLRQDPKVHQIPFIPPMVDIADVDIDTGRLVSLDAFEEYKLSIDKSCPEKNGKCSKKNLKSKYSIAKIGDQYYAIYKGESHNKLLGKGAFGSVKLAQNIHDGTWVVFKSISKKDDHSTNNHNKAVASEVDILKKTNMFLGGYRVTNSSKGMHDILVMPLARGISVKRLIKNRDMPAVKWIDVAIQMSEAAYGINQLGLVHRDIKPENMLYDPTTAKVKLVDFGLTRAFKKGKTEYLGGRSGSHRYMAPELQSRKKKTCIYSQATEVYALGVSLLECFQMNRESQGVMCDVDFYSKIRNPYVREALMRLVKEMLQPHPDKRPSLKDVVQRLNDLRAEHLDVMSKIATLAYLDLKSYRKLPKQLWLRLTRSLLGVDEVHLVDTDGQFDPLTSLAMKHDLERMGVFVANQVVSVCAATKSAALDRLRGFTAERSNIMNVLYSAYYVNPLNNFTDDFDLRFARSIDRFTVSLRHKEMVLSNINAQIVRIKDKDPHDQRLVLLSRFSKGLTNDEDLNYRTLFIKLDELQVQIDAVKKQEKKQRFMRFFGGLPTATTKIAETSRKLSLDLHGLNNNHSNH